MHNISSLIQPYFRNTLFLIECCNGKLISQYAYYRNEEEVILMPKTTFTVISDPLNHVGGLNIVHLKEITDDADERTNLNEHEINSVKA
ncbi:unnamed protein product [Adineta steineri]|uniref:NAD(P)(+)--arginine ADP-ribosyltransferase n=1 Tax=Adineta steineri TaxID=433720 RepID=A0A818ZFM5_9BILA|nr:unnamed protein product [Adineta steineri]CAF3496266.1 unnamed protein product [Adineta steineri]CAF3768410.1 unnamed protein product [Adineta steineri]